MTCDRIALIAIYPPGIVCMALGVKATGSMHSTAEFTATRHMPCAVLLNHKQITADLATYVRMTQCLKGKSRLENVAEALPALCRGTGSI